MKWYEILVLLLWGIIMLGITYLGILDMSWRM